VTATEIAITFPTGIRARAVRVPASIDGETVIQQLGLPPPKGTLVVNGSTARLGADLKRRLTTVIGEGVARVALEDGLTVVTGATDAGIFSILGSAMTGRSAPLVGVAPAGLVRWPGKHAGWLRWLDRGKEDLEPHHSHFVLVEGDGWGDETPPLLSLTSALAARAPSVAILSGGGKGSRREVIGHSRAGRPLVVLAESGRLADELAEAVAAGDADDPLVAEVVKKGKVTVCSLSAGARAVAEAVRRALR
jgi:hypothetical protein